jgi:cysteinyl-tRNA synthetase
MKIYNSLSRNLEEFKPKQEGKVNIYVCGPTVYGPSHLGHASTYIAFDIIRRAFRYLNYEVKYVVNLTDIHDDMIKEANRRGITLFELADENIEQYMEDLETLNILSADVYPRVTEHIKDIIETVEKLEDKGYGYETDDGVYYNVAKFRDYGKLSGINFEEGKTGERVETDKYDKETKADFALWKKSKPDEPSWDSPWGEGRPGWHIECSVMSRKYLGQPIDIHGGALDLKFPHHENEIAQSEAAYDKKFVNYWMHAGLLNVDGRKMSKSFGNFINIPQLLEKYDPMVLRYWRATVHYRSSINYEDKIMESAKSALNKLRDAVLRWHRKTLKQGVKKADGKTEQKQDRKRVQDQDNVKPDNLAITGKVLKGYKEEFIEALEDDFAMPEAVAVLWEVVNDSEASGSDKLATVLDFDRVLGLGLEDYIYAKSLGNVDDKFKKKVEALIKKRNQARDAKDWEKADELRDKLSEMDIIIEDTADGTVWRIR